MYEEQLKALAKRLGISCANLKWERELLGRLLKNRKRSRPDDSAMIDHILPRIDAMEQVEVERLLTGEAYRQHPALFDPPRKRRQPEAPIRRYGTIRRIKKQNARYRYSDEKSAKVAYPLFQDQYSKPEYLVRCYFNDCKTITELEAERGPLKQGLIRNLVWRYRYDSYAMRIWDDFSYAWQILSCRLSEDFDLFLRASRNLDKVARTTHPFAIELRLILMPVSHTWDDMNLCLENEAPQVTPLVIRTMRRLHLLKGGKQVNRG